MSETFGVGYAEVYDAIYHDKDYAAECDLVERVLSANTAAPVRRILDLGCGTGRHAELLADRGYEVVGVDRSPHMIEQARARAEKRRSPDSPDYHVADLRSFRMDRRFDAALMMFAVLSYQLDDEDVAAALRTARIHLRDGGLLLFDCWYGPAVLHQRPANRTKSAPAAGGRLIRTSASELDERRRRITVHFHVDRSAAGKEQQTEETHPMRYFFASEIEEFLHAEGFSLVRIGAVPDFDRNADETTWNVLVVALADRPLNA
jgi:SAM-dependent methyltransferase